ncbi:MAG TPA: alkaline phosphatase D family protein [Actinomycetota bacterium]|nr:alkaline phosphatase D family protein [Actinomycetota bacterium]
MDTTRRTFIAGTLAAGGVLSGRALPVVGKRARGKRPLFQDTFARPSTDGWGWPWFNQRYGRQWSVHNGKAILRLPPTVSTAYYRPNPVLVLDHDVANIDIRATVSNLNRTARTGVLARASGYSDFYAAYIGPGNVFRVGRCDAQDEKLLGRRYIEVADKQHYRIRLQVRGSGPVTVRAKAWPATSPEPAEWMIDRVDADPKAITGKGAFGIFTQHATDGRGSVARVHDFVARSAETPSTTAPTIAYALTGPPTERGIRAIAKAVVPAFIGFEYGPEPTLTQNVLKVKGGRASERAQTAKADLSLDLFGPARPVYWRAFAERRGYRVYGPTSSFRTAPAAGETIRFAFGSCTKWAVHPKNSFEHARLKQVDFFLHQGDFGYVPHRVIAHAPDTYQDHWTRMLLDPKLSALTREMPFGFYRDDAEYGLDDANRYTFRKFVASAHDELNANPRGPYFQFRYGDAAFFVIDCRRFSSGRGLPQNERYKLGAVQKRWLFAAMEAAVADDAGVLIVASPQAFGSDASPASWKNNYPAEWDELMEFFIGLGRPVLIISGDAHGHRLHEYPQRSSDPSVPRLVEFVSAGTEQTRFSDEIDPRIAVKFAKGSGFGVVEIGPEQTIGDQRARTLSLSAFRSDDGTPYWSNNYLIVRDIGIFPIGGV